MPILLEKNKLSHLPSYKSEDIVQALIKEVPFKKLYWKGVLLDNHDVYDHSNVNKYEVNKYEVNNYESKSDTNFVDKPKSIPIIEELLSEMDRLYPNDNIRELGLWINHYRNKNDFIRWHKDSLTKKRTIYILSFGSSRPILFRKNPGENKEYEKDGGDLLGFILEHGDILTMSNDDNDNYMHMVPKMGDTDVADISRISVVLS